MAIPISQDGMYFDPERNAVVWEEWIGREGTDQEIETADRKLMQEMGITWEGVE